MNPSILDQRFRCLPAAHPAESLVISKGSLRDYKKLSQHHYRAGLPATSTRVLVMHDPSERLIDRWKIMHPEATEKSTPDAKTPVAVLVESLSALSCKMRDFALSDRYGSWLTPKERARLINDELRCISRVVVHPQWRGLGLAVRLVRHALATATTPLTEALAAMGRVSPFFEHAGMTAYERPSHRYDARLVAALERLGWSARDLALHDQILGRISELPESQRHWITREFYLWYRQAGERNPDASVDLTQHLLTARQKLLLEPIYYLHVKDSQKTLRTS